MHFCGQGMEYIPEGPSFSLRVEARGDPTDDAVGQEHGRGCGVEAKLRSETILWICDE